MWAGKFRLERCKKRMVKILCQNAEKWAAAFGKFTKCLTFCIEITIFNV